MTRLLVGGPSTAAAGWVDDLLHHAGDTGVPVDFVTTHTYGAPPLDLRPILERFGRPDIPIWWTEWGVSPTHGGAVNDSVWGAPLVARGMRSAAGRVDALAYWVASDQFVELGVPERLFHGGFGLLTIGGLRKPRFWAIALLERLGEQELASQVTGDGGGSLVEAWASRDVGGETGDRVAVALWNGSLDQIQDRRRRRPRPPGDAGDHGPGARCVPRRAPSSRPAALEHRPDLGGAGRRRLADGGASGSGSGRPTG